MLIESGFSLVFKCEVIVALCSSKTSAETDVNKDAVPGKTYRNCGYSRICVNCRND